MYAVGCNHASPSSALRLFDQLKSEQIHMAPIWQSSRIYESNIEFEIT